jgi:hypothetical protein
MLILITKMSRTGLQSTPSVKVSALAFKKLFYFQTFRVDIYKFFRPLLKRYSLSKKKTLLPNIT